ncbi:MAG: hydroxymethylbilane synthase [Firmicutes bacterium]|nr:hydroxymethylbilane synthase [Bacillota bacterium]
MKRTVRVGSRESRLAVIQTQWVMERIQAVYPEITWELFTMKSTGDIILNQTLDTIGGKGLFIKELERALLEGRIDLAVHSLKDMPFKLDPRLPIVGLTAREDPWDVLVYPLKMQAVAGPAGCSSARRRVQLKKLFPDMKVEPVRGNVLTRLTKLDQGQYGSLVLAAAGLRRLGLQQRISRLFTLDEMIPAAGQGILAVQGRAGEDYSYLDAVRDPEATDQAAAERAFIAALDGGCSAPVAAYAEIQGQELCLHGLYAEEEAGIFYRGHIVGSRTQAARLGEELAQRLKQEAKL